MSNRKILFGFILILIGLAFMVNTLDLIRFSFEDFLSFAFPILLIAVGLWLMMRRRQQDKIDAEVHIQEQKTVRPDRVYATPEPPPGPRPFDPGEAESGQPRVSEAPSEKGGGKIRYSKFIGDMFIDCDGVSLQNLEINNFLGDVEVKLHGGQLVPGLNRLIISGFIGDVRVLVPQGMAVFAQSTNFIGDIEMMGRRSSGFGNSLDAQTPTYADSDSKLYVASNHFIGDVRVYIV